MCPFDDSAHLRSTSQSVHVSAAPRLCNVPLQVDGFETKVVHRVVDDTLSKLVELNVVPAGTSRISGGLVLPFFLHRIPDHLLGRDTLVSTVKAALKDQRSALIVGGPGEGKSSLGMEAAVQLLQEDEHYPGGTFKVDMIGTALHAIASQRPNGQFAEKHCSSSNLGQIE